MLKDPSIIGQKFTTKTGDIITIIDGENKKNLTIQFEDGLIQKNKNYWAIQKGQIIHPSKNPYMNWHKKHIGETYITNSGEKVTIIDDKDSTHITIKFEDGTIKKNVIYNNVKNGHIAHPSKTPVKSFKHYIGETHITNSGDKFTIIDGNNTGNLIIQFEDGTIRKNVNYHSIKTGKVRHPSKSPKSIEEHIGETFLTNSGHIATIIGGTNATHMTIKFDDGIIRENIKYCALQKGQIAHSSKNRKSVKNCINETFITKSGLKTTIINGENMHNLTIQFEDNILKNNVSYTTLKSGKISHPYLNKQSKQFHSIKLNYKYENQTYSPYDCTCEICGKNMLLTPVGLMQHHLTCQKET